MFKKYDLIAKMFELMNNLNIKYKVGFPNFYYQFINTHGATSKL